MQYRNVDKDPGSFVVAQKNYCFLIQKLFFKKLFIAAFDHVFRTRNVLQ